MCARAAVFVSVSAREGECLCLCMLSLVSGTVFRYAILP